MLFLSLLLSSLESWLMVLFKLGFMLGLAFVVFLVIRLLILKNFPKKNKPNP